MASETDRDNLERAEGAEDCDWCGKGPLIVISEINNVDEKGNRLNLEEISRRPENVDRFPLYYCQKCRRVHSNKGEPLSFPAIPAVKLIFYDPKEKMLMYGVHPLG